MAKPSSNTRSSARSKDEKFHSQSRRSRIFHGICQHIQDTKARRKLLHEAKALSTQKSPLEPTTATLKQPISVSKAVSIYSYISAPGYSVQFSVPGANGMVTNTSNDNFAAKELEIDSNNTPS